jgi:ribonuclease Y
VDLLQVAAGGLLLLALVAMIVVWALWKRSRGAAARLIANAENEAKKIVARGEIEGKRIQKDAEILARERLLAARTEFERETRDVRVEVSGLASRLEEQKTELEQRAAELEERDSAMKSLETEIEERNNRLVEHEQELENAIAEQRSRLEQIAGLTVDQAKAELLRSMENEARIDAANVVKRIEDETTEKAKEKARRVISMAIQRIASEHVVESTVSVGCRPAVR